MFQNGTAYRDTCRITYKKYLYVMNKVSIINPRDNASLLVARSIEHECDSRRYNAAREAEPSRGETVVNHRDRRDKMYRMLDRRKTKVTNVYRESHSAEYLRASNGESESPKSESPVPDRVLSATNCSTYYCCANNQSLTRRTSDDPHTYCSNHRRGLFR